MRVVLVSPYALDVVGGVQAHVLSLAAALRHAGDEVLVIGPAADRLGTGATETSVRTVGRSVAVPANGSRAPVALDPRSAVRTRALVRRAAPDVVHVHEPLVPLVGPAAVTAGSGAVLVTFHASADGGNLPRLYRSVRAPARAVLRGADGMTAVSPVAAAFHARMLGLPAGSMPIVPNGVDVVRFRGVDGRTSPHGRRLVFLGRLEPRKGVDVALEAFLRLAPSRPDLELLVLGDGPLAPELRARLARVPPGVAGRVELSGRADPRDLPALLAGGDVALLPARGGESFGIVLLEAMAAGVAVVATDIAGYRDVARHDVEALLVPPGDAVALAAATARVLDDPVLAARLVAAGGRRAEEHDWALVAARTREHYAEAIARRTRRTRRPPDPGRPAGEGTPPDRVGP